MANKFLMREKLESLNKCFSVSAYTYKFDFDLIVVLPAQSKVM